MWLSCVLLVLLVAPSALAGATKNHYGRRLAGAMVDSWHVSTRDMNSWAHRLLQSGSPYKMYATVREEDESYKGKDDESDKNTDDESDKNTSDQSDKDTSDQSDKGKGDQSDKNVRTRV
ncbi:hypothetical protein FOA52_001977 [Chlamydomonas sp. UWO 241]|nr:hypothetical protein FOA52_001977 [Chlamydomonas sp. UWO 241]